MGKPQLRHNNEPHETSTLSLTQLFFSSNSNTQKHQEIENEKINEALYQHTCKIH